MFRMSWVQIPSLYSGLTFFAYICCKNCNDVCLKWPKINNKRDRGLPTFFKKKFLETKNGVICSVTTVLEFLLCVATVFVVYLTKQIGSQGGLLSILRSTLEEKVTESCSFERLWPWRWWRSCGLRKRMITLDQGFVSLTLSNMRIVQRLKINWKDIGKRANVIFMIFSLLMEYLSKDNAYIRLGTDH